MTFRILFTALFTLLYSTVEAQIEVTPVFINTCDSSIVSSEKIVLRKDENRYSSSNGIFKLQEVGNYTVDYKSFSMMGFVTVSAGQDTIYLPQLYYLVQISFPPIFSYFNCSNENADGHIVDHYRDGTKRLEGVFSENRAIDTLTLFYPSGTIWKQIFYTDSGHRNGLKEFYESGTLKRYEDLNNEIFKKYYDNGILKEEVQFTGEYYRYNYYKNGTPKRLADGLDFKEFDSVGSQIQKSKTKTTAFSPMLGITSLKTKWSRSFPKKGGSVIKYSSFSEDDVASEIKDLNQISFDKAVFKKYNKKYKKIEPSYEGGKSVLSIYKRKGLRWVLISQLPEDKLVETIVEIEKEIVTIKL